MSKLFKQQQQEPQPEYNPRRYVHHSREESFERVQEILPPLPFDIEKPDWQYIFAPLTNHVDINTRDYFGATALYTPSKLNLSGVVMELMYNPLINPNIPNVYGGTAFFAACETGSKEVVKFLMNDDRVDVTLAPLGTTVFHKACQMGRAEVVKLLLADARFNVTELVEGKDALYVASTAGHAEVVKLLLADERFDPLANTQTNHPFADACQFGTLEVVNAFLECPRFKNNPPANLFCNIKYKEKKGELNEIKVQVALFLMNKAEIFERDQ